MENNIPLIQRILMCQQEEIKLADLKEFYSPIDLAKQLNALEGQQLIIIDWEYKTIRKNLTFEKVLTKKNELISFKREIPEYMKGEQIEINQPYLKKIKKRGED